MTDIIHWVLIGLSVPFVVIVAIMTVRRARELNRRIEEERGREPGDGGQEGQ